MIKRPETINELVEKEEPHRLKVLIPRIESGSVEHFAHFMDNYFLGATLIMAQNPETHFVVRECGPCTDWFSLLQERYRLSVVPKSKLLAHQEADNGVVEYVGSESEVGWNSRRINDFLRTLGIFEEETKSNSGIVARREFVHPFYTGGKSESPGSGPMRRTITNQARIDYFLTRFLKGIPVEFGLLSPSQSIELVKNARYFVAQRGAALMNIVFMPRGSFVLEIMPKEMKHKPNADLYRSIARARGLRYSRIYQRSKKGRANSLAVAIWVLLRGFVARST